MSKKIEDIKRKDDNKSENQSKEENMNKSNGNSEGKSVRKIQIEQNKARKPFNSRRRSVSRERVASRWGLWVAVVLVVVVLFFAASILFTGATVEIEPKTADVSVDGSFIAYKNPVIEEDLGFEVMTVTREMSRNVPASGEEFVEEKASGEITIFNNYSSRPQRLIDNTRFESPDGLIYRIKDGVTVPGRKEVDGEVVPGSLTVKVFADEPGDEYNIGLTDFTIPGLKGDPRFDKMFARSETEMTGGFSGTIKRAKEEDLLEARAEMREELRSELIREAVTVKPEKFILLDDSYEITFDEKKENLTGDDSEEDMVKIIQEGTLNSFIFENEKLAEILARDLVTDYEGNPVELGSTENLNFSTIGEISSLQSIEELDFNLQGGVKIVWQVPEDELIEELLGESRKKLDIIFSRFDGIEKVETTIRPFWKRSMPDSKEDIKIKKIID